MLVPSKHTMSGLRLFTDVQRTSSSLRRADVLSEMSRKRLVADVQWTSAHRCIPLFQLKARCAVGSELRRQTTMHASYPRDDHKRALVKTDRKMRSINWSITPSLEACLWKRFAFKKSCVKLLQVWGYFAPPRGGGRRPVAVVTHFFCASDLLYFYHWEQWCDKHSSK